MRMPLSHAPTMRPVYKISHRTNSKSHSGTLFFILLLAAQAFSVFLTETKFIPSIKYNIGVFEVTGLIMFTSVFIYLIKNNISLKIHPLMYLLGLIVIIASLSTLNLPTEQQKFGFISLILLMLTSAFTVTLYNFVLLHKSYFLYLIRFVAYSTAIVAIWVLIDGILSGGDISAVGPFRNRAHASIYMFASLWVVLFNISIPNTSKLQQCLFYAMLPLLFYCVSIGGRRSIYVALIFGLACLILGVAIVRCRGRMKILAPVIIGLISLGSLHFVFSEFWAPAAFFKERMSAEGGQSVGGRLRAFTASTEDVEFMQSFTVLQRQGALRAFSENPVLGIGWGGFYESEYSPTGHEMHSTPMRFLAETGIIGFVAYLVFMLALLWKSLKLLLSTRGTSYELPALILFIALCSLSTGYIYNRQVTDRSFWLILVIFMSFETIIYDKFHKFNMSKRRQPALNLNRRQAARI